MARITEYYGITDPVPFVDIDVDKDNPLFLDPHAIRLQRAPEPFVSRALAATDRFFGEVTRCALSSDLSDRARGLDLLQHFEEPWETRFGLAKEGFRGHGGAKEVGSWVWEALTTDLEALLSPDPPIDLSVVLAGRGEMPLCAERIGLVEGLIQASRRAFRRCNYLIAVRCGAPCSMNRI